MVLLQHVQLGLSILPRRYMALNQNPTQLIDQLSVVLALRDVEAHPAHSLRQLLHYLLQPLCLVHLLELSIDRLQPFLQLHHLCVLLIHVLTDLGLSELL